MFFRVAVLAFLFIVRLRFPRDKSVGEVIRSRYGNAALKLARKVEKTDFKLRKTKLDLEFLETCLHHGVTPTFLKFRLSNRHLQTSPAYRSCQSKLLREEIKIKNARIRHLESTFTSLKASLRDELRLVDYTHVCCLFLSQN